MHVFSVHKVVSLRFFSLFFHLHVSVSHQASLWDKAKANMCRQTVMTFDRLPAVFSGQGLHVSTFL